MNRRGFLGLLGFAATWPVVARAQRGKLPTIAVLGTGSATLWAPWIAAFVQRLGELGLSEGRTVAIEYRWAEGRPERMAEYAAEFVQLKVDIIVTAGSAVPALKRATSSIPIVFAVANEPVRGGLVANLRHPGGNVTGLSAQQTDLAGKKIEILREIAPRLRRLAVLANTGAHESTLEIGDVQNLARQLGLDVVRFEIRRAEEIASGFESIGGRADALYVITDGLVAANHVRINSLALAARLPTIWSSRDYLEGGGLISYGPNYPDLFRRAADYVDKILRGAKPGDLPIEQPTKFDLAINLVTAKTLGLTIPESILLRASEVIE